ncbi:MAG: penicillin-binding protein 2 [Scrofimicrobium sp.]
MTRSGNGAVDGPMPKARSRGKVAWIIALMALIACGVQLFNIQIVRGAELAEQGRIVRTSALPVDAPRGSIVDADGQVLVDTVKTYHVAVRQTIIPEFRNYEDGKLVGTGPAEAARLLAPILGRDPSELGGELVGESQYQYLAKNVDLQTSREIRALDIYGIELEPSFERQYPAGTTAATVVGTVDYEGNGSSGLELTFNDLLTGVPGEEAYEIGPTGARMPGAKVTTKEAVPGATLHTSIHSDLQYSIQELLDQSVTQWGAEWGSVVIMDVATSRILVLADSFERSPLEGPQSSATVQNLYEPGSVGKVLTFATALQKGTITPTTRYSVPATIDIGDQRFHDYYADHPTYDLTATGVLAMSSNTGTIQVGMTVSDEDRYQTFLDFGLGQLTGVELPGETAGMLGTPDSWDGRTKFANMFGQGVGVNVLQTTAIGAVIGNDGVWNAPHLVDGWTSADGIYHEKETATPREALSPEVAKTLRTMMESVVVDEIGTGQLAAVEGYRIAAKTGTAEVAGGGIVPSIMGIIPADDPQIVITAMLYKPSNTLPEGNTVGPLFSSSVAEAVRMLGIAPSAEPARLFPSE